jgi:hypothetical protein
MAYTYCITFRIADKTVLGATYADRRQKLIDNARAEELGYWEETTWSRHSKRRNSLRESVED